MLTTHNIDIQAMFVWLTLPFYDFCGFRSVAVNSVYKLQFFTFITCIIRVGIRNIVCPSLWPRHWNNSGVSLGEFLSYHCSIDRCGRRAGVSVLAELRACLTCDWLSWDSWAESCTPTYPMWYASLKVLKYKSLIYNKLRQCIYLDNTTQ